MTIVPPVAGVALVELHDRIALTPLCWCREFVGLGKYDSREVGPDKGSPLHPFFTKVTKGKKIWVVTAWRQYEDGREEILRTNLLDPASTRTQALRVYQSAIEFASHGRKELEELSTLFEAGPEDMEYIDTRFPKIQNPGGTMAESDLYQARLKTLAGLQPKTVELMQRADVAKDPNVRVQLEREAIHAYFADLAHFWTDDALNEWLRNNPPGSHWLCEFAKVKAEPKRELDPVNHELALNWIRSKYNLLTAEELSREIQNATGQRVSAATIKKRRERLGLTTKRTPGPRPNSER